MKNKKRNRIFLLLILLLGIGVGFAALSTTLKINGSAVITKNTWNIYWDNIANQSGVTPTIAPSISNEDSDHQKNTVSFGVTLDKPGDFYEFTVDAVNAGSLDAEITKIEYKLNGVKMDEDNKLPDYIKYTVAYADGIGIKTGRLLVKAPDLTSDPPVYTREPIRVRIEYDKDAVTNNDINEQDGNVTYDLAFEITYGQATENAKPPRVAADFGEDDWDDIVASYEDGDPEGTLDQAMKDGVTKPVGLDTDHDGEADTTAYVRIANLSTPEACSSANFSQTACGFVIEFTGLIGSHSMSSNGSVGGWEASDMRAYLNSGVYGNTDYTGVGIIDALPDDLKNSIISTKVVSGYENGGASHGNYITNDKIYLLDAKEVYGDSANGQPLSALSYERQLDYYAYVGASLSNLTPVRKKSIGSSSYSAWWLRSARTLYAYDFFDVADTGRLANSNAGYGYGVSPAFRIGEKKSN